MDEVKGPHPVETCGCDTCRKVMAELEKHAKAITLVFKGHNYTFKGRIIDVDNKVVIFANSDEVAPWVK